MTSKFSDEVTHVYIENLYNKINYYQDKSMEYMDKYSKALDVIYEEREENRRLKEKLDELIDGDKNDK